MEEFKIEPYQIDVDENKLASIDAKVRNFDWSVLPDVGGWEAGVGIKDLKRLTDYWIQSYDWNKTAQRINQLPNFLANIEGETIHFVHYRSTGSKPAILLLHGWPGSFLESGNIPQHLVSDGHDVIVPSLPGFAFSKPISGVIGPRRAAELFAKLMRLLFKDEDYIVQGGDWGAHIASWMAYHQPIGLMGIHINMAAIYPSDIQAILLEEKEVFFRREEILDWETGYNHEQETRPQTLGVAMADSPVGLAGWILEKFGKWTDLLKKNDGSPDIWENFRKNNSWTISCCTL